MFGILAREKAHMMMCLTSVTLSGGVGWAFWSVNFPKFNKGQDRAVNVILNSEILHSGCARCEQSYF